MKRILITGMSGTGKSTVINDLTARGYNAVDLDCADYSEWVDVRDDAQQPGTPVEVNKDWVWREAQIQELLSTDDDETLFLSGCASNMGEFRQQFDHVILLSAAAPIIMHRLKTRQSNQYGKQSHQQERVLSLIEAVEPLLRRTADHEIDTGTTSREFERVYALTERVAPAHLIREVSDEEVDRFLIKKAIGFAGLSRLRRTQRGVPFSKKQQLCEALLADSEIIEVKIEGQRATHYALRSDAELLNELIAGRILKSWAPLETTTAEEVVFHAPLDPVSARGRAKTLFDFD